jgi:hypothetical protein
MQLLKDSLSNVKCNACTTAVIQSHVVYLAAMCRQLIWCLQLVHLPGKPPSAAGRNKRFGANLRQVKWRAWEADPRSVRLTFAKLKKASANNSNDGYPVFYRCRYNSVNLCGNICSRFVRRAMGWNGQKDFLSTFVVLVKQHEEILMFCLSGLEKTSFYCCRHIITAALYVS